MPRKVKLTVEDQLRFDHFVTTDAFAEVLASACRDGSKRNDSSAIRRLRNLIVASFSVLVERS
ncbi:hypothetical protein FO601_37600, partial [Bacillus thuringiensis]|nr:hypothetical protein [Bacillus thuringiensis]